MYDIYIYNLSYVLGGYPGLSYNVIIPVPLFSRLFLSLSPMFGIKWMWATLRTIITYFRNDTVMIQFNLARLGKMSFK